MVVGTKPHNILKAVCFITSGFFVLEMLGIELYKYVLSIDHFERHRNIGNIGK